MTSAGWARLDTAVAVVTFVGLTTPALLGYPSREGAAAAVVAFGAASSLPLALRRRWPLPVLAVVVAATAVGTAAGVRFTPFVSNASPVVALAMYTVAARYGRRVSLTALALAVAASWVSTGIAYEAHPDQDHNAVHMVAAVVGWVAGDMVRARRAYRAELDAHLRGEAAERTGRVVAEERLRISHEVHDVVTHSLSIIAVQAGAGRMVFDTQPDRARTALAAIEKASRSALDDLRRVLGSLREGPATRGVADDDPSLRTGPGLSDLETLIDDVRANGVDVSLSLSRPRDELPAMLELSAYRIVQEALTNAMRHAPGAPIAVVVAHPPGSLTIEVTNAAPAPGPTTIVTDRSSPPAPVTEGRDQATASTTSQPSRGAATIPTSDDGGWIVVSTSGRGWGLAGMRERAALFAGTVEAGPRSDGGFRVTVRLVVGDKEARRRP